MRIKSLEKRLGPIRVGQFFQNLTIICANRPSLPIPRTFLAYFTPTFFNSKDLKKDCQWDKIGVNSDHNRLSVQLTYSSSTIYSLLDKTL